MEYSDVIKKLNKKIDINYYLKSVVGLCARFINSDECFKVPTDDESLINITAPNKLWTKKDKLKQKLAERWIRKYIKDLRDAPKKDEAIISYLWKDATTYAEKICPTINVSCENSSQKNNTYFNILDGHEKSIYSKLSTLLVEISNLFTGYREGLYILVNESHKYNGASVKTHISKSTILEEYILTDILESECEVLIDFRNT